MRLPCLIAVTARVTRRAGTRCLPLVGVEAGIGTRTRLGISCLMALWYGRAAARVVVPPAAWLRLLILAGSLALPGAPRREDIGQRTVATMLPLIPLLSCVGAGSRVRPVTVLSVLPPVGPLARVPRRRSSPSPSLPRSAGTSTSTSAGTGTGTGTGTGQRSRSTRPCPTRRSRRAVTTRQRTGLAARVIRSGRAGWRLCPVLLPAGQERAEPLAA
jgi:hypothetical protein